jgi:hypothetical protein
MLGVKVVFLWKMLEVRWKMCFWFGICWMEREDTLHVNDI